MRSKPCGQSTKPGAVVLSADPRTLPRPPPTTRKNGNPSITTQFCPPQRAERKIDGLMAHLIPFIAARTLSLAVRPVVDWAKTIDVNFTALLYITATLLPDMYERNFGFVVNISSAAGMIGVPNLAVYSATK